MNERAMIELMVKQLEDFEKKGWITINENLRHDALAMSLLEVIIQAPYVVFMRFMRDRLP